MSTLVPPPDSSAASSPQIHLLIVEDEPLLRRLFATMLKAAGYSVAEAEDGFAALEQVRHRRPALVLSDLNMPRMTGFELLSVIRRRFPSMHVIAMSGAFPGQNMPSGVAADAFYEKSGRPIGTLVAVIEDILHTHPATAGNREDPHVALWVTRRGLVLEGSNILLNCPECLRSFPYASEPKTSMQLRETPCVFCGTPVAYALLDPTAPHHSGYAPTQA